MKRIISLILSAVMCISMTVGVAATDVTGLDAMRILAEEEDMTSVEFDEPLTLYSYNPFVGAMSSKKLGGIIQLEPGMEILIRNDSTVTGDFVYIYIEEYTKSETTREFEEWDMETDESVIVDYKGEYVCTGDLLIYDISTGAWQDDMYVEPGMIYDSGNYLNPGESVSIKLPEQENTIFKLFTEIYNMDGSTWFHKYVHFTYDNFALPEEIIGNDEMWLQGNTVTVNCEDYGACNVVIALYDGNGKLIAVEMKPATVTDDTVSVEFDKKQIESMADASAFILSDDNTLVPLDKKIVLNTKGESKLTFESVDEEIANLIVLNNNEVPEIYCGSEDMPSFIMGTFSDETVNSAEDAIDALNDIHNIMQFENAAEEFEEVYSETVDFGEETNFYRLQQTYKDIPVYGHQVIVSTDAEGVTQTMSGNYFPNIDLDVTPTVTEDEAKAAVNAGAVESLTSKGLCIYIKDDTAVLCWQIGDAESNHFVDAKTGEIMDVHSEVRGSDWYTGTDMNGQSVDIPLIKTEDEFDDEGNVISYVYEFSDQENNVFVWDYTYWGAGTSGDGHIYKTAENWCKETRAVSAYGNLCAVLKYYSSVLGRNGADNNGNEVCLVVHFYDPNKPNETYKNAEYVGSSKENGYVLIRFGDGDYYVKALDVVAHEFTHAVTAYTWDGMYSGESGALNEAYSDILGELIQDGTLDVIGEDLSKPIRSFSTPEKYNQPSHYSDLKVCSLPGNHSEHDADKDGKSDCDNNYVHTNSGIINHAAYLMEKNWPTSDGRAEELAKLFYKSMFYLHSQSKFNDCYAAVLATARDMNMSEEKLDVIAEAFADVGVGNAYFLGSHVTGIVTDAETNEPVAGVKVTAEMVGKGFMAYADLTVAGLTDKNGYFDLVVYPNVGTVSFSAQDYQTEQMEINLLDTSFKGAKDLGVIALAPSVTVFGEVISSEDNMPVENAKIKFRAGADNKTDDYIRNEDGVIVVYTNSEGEFSTDALGRGTYTMEVSADGYKTGYMNIEAGSPEAGIGADLNVALTPIIRYDVSGLVACDESTADLSGIIVTVADADGNSIGWTNADAAGNYSVHLEAGTYTLEFSGDGYETTSVGLIVDENGQYALPTVTIKIAGIPMPTALTGSVNKMGYCFDVWTPITNATITLSNESGREESVESTDGTFTFEEYDRTQAHKLTVDWYNSVQMSNITITEDIPVGYDLREDFTIAFKSKNVAGFNSEENKYRDRLKYGLIVYSKNDYELIIPEVISAQ